MSFQYCIKKNQKFIDELKKKINSKETLNLLQCVEGDFVIYYGVYAELKPLKFTFHLIKQFFLKKKFFLKKNIKGRGIKKIVTIITADYLYNENLNPLLSKIYKNKKFSNIQLRLNIKRHLSLIRAKFKNYNYFSVVFFFKNTKFFSYRSLIKILYIKYILLIDAENLLKNLKKQIPKNYSLMVSTEVCNFFSRVSALISKSKKKNFVLFQCGPLNIHNNHEINSIICDEFIAWNSSLEYFSDSIISKRHIDKKISYFSPVREMRLEKFKKKKMYDLIFFLTWVNYSSPSLYIYETLNKIYTLIKKKKLKVAFKFHPNTEPIQENNYKKLFPDIEFISKSADTLKFINASKIVLSFGSTISFDAEKMNIKTGVVNFNGNFSDDHQLFYQTNIKNIKSIIDLDDFLNCDRVENVIKKKLTNKSLLNYIKKKIL